MCKNGEMSLYNAKNWVDILDTGILIHYSLETTVSAHMPLIRIRNKYVTYAYSTYKTNLMA